mgnify:CR=1 FL=1
MRLQLPQQIDRTQWLARLGYSDHAIEQLLSGHAEVEKHAARDEAEAEAQSPEDPRLLQQMEAAERKLLDAAIPQGVYRVMELEWNRDNESEGTPVLAKENGAGLLKSKVIELSGSAIKRHLAECNGMVIMAVTLGAGVDRLIRTAQIRDMAEAVLLDSGASILAEQCADILEETIHAETGKLMAESDGAADASGVPNDCDALKPGETTQTYFTGRYSPGYGDFPIEMQGQLIKAMDGPRTIGLSTNESYILIPRKSITAIIGTADHPVTGYLATCDECQLGGKCALQQAGKPCWSK